MQAIRRALCTGALCLPLTAAAQQQVNITGAAIRAAESLPLDLPATSGSRLGLTPMETPASVDILTREMLRERGDRTTQDALENAAGVAAGQCFGLTCFSMRGFSNNLSLPFLFDGLRYPGLAFSPRGTFVFDRPATPYIGLNPTAYAGFTYGRPSPDQEYLTGPQHTGRLVVTRLDTVAHVVSGTFEFTAVEVSGGLTGNGTPVPGGKTVRVTEGRFDCKF